MRFILRVSTLLALAVVTARAQINPATQIDWARVTGCSTSGYVYSPGSGQCVALGAGNPAGASGTFQYNNSGVFGGYSPAAALSALGALGNAGGTLYGPLIGTSASFAALNGTEYGGVGANTTIQAAIAALPSGGGKVVIPAGTYNLSSEVLLATASGGQYELCGEGPGTVLSITGTNGGVHITGTPGASRSYVKLCDMTITASASSGTAAFGYHLDGIADFTVEDVNVFGGTFTYGEWLTGAQQGEIRGGFVQPSTNNTGNGLMVDQAGGDVNSNGVEIHGQSYNGGQYCAYYNLVDDIHFHDNHLTSCTNGVHVIGEYGFAEVRSNHFEDMTGVGVYGASWVHDNDFFTTGTGAGGPMDVVCPVGLPCDITDNLIQAGINLVGGGVQNRQVSNNIFETYVTVTDAALDTLYINNAGLGAAQAGPIQWNSNGGFTFNVTKQQVGGALATFGAPGQTTGGPWGLQVTGAGDGQDVYLQLANVLWAGSTSGGTMTLKSGVGGTTWATFRSSGLALNTETLSSPAPAVSSGQIGYGGTVVASTSCGTLAGAAGCLVINVGGTTRYIPYY